LHDFISYLQILAILVCEILPPSTSTVGALQLSELSDAAPVADLHVCVRARADAESARFAQTRVRYRAMSNIFCILTTHLFVRFDSENVLVSVSVGTHADFAVCFGSAPG
jgi:hypothetical protein